MEKSTHTPLYDAFRRRLAAYRKEAGLTQRELAARLGREPSFVARLELGERRLDVVEFYWLIRACGAEPAKAAAGVMRELAEADRAASLQRRGRRRGRH